MFFGILKCIQCALLLLYCRRLFGMDFFDCHNVLGGGELIINSVCFCGNWKSFCWIWDVQICVENAKTVEGVNCMNVFPFESCEIQEIYS